MTITETDIDVDDSIVTAIEWIYKIRGNYFFASSYVKTRYPDFGISNFDAGTEE